MEIWKVKEVDEVFGYVLSVLTITGCIADGVTMNPIIIGVLTGVGVIIQGYVAQSKFNSEIEECKFAFTSYDKILTQHCRHLRGSPYNEEVLLAELKLIDDIIIDRCPPISKLSKRYDGEYSPEGECDRTK